MEGARRGDGNVGVLSFHASGGSGGLFFSRPSGITNHFVGTLMTHEPDDDGNDIGDHDVGAIASH